MFSIYNLFLDSNFIILNGEPEGYKTNVAQYILKRIENNKAKSELVSLLNLSFKTVIVGSHMKSNYYINKDNFNDIYELYESEYFDFIIFEKLPEINLPEWLEFKNFVVKKNMQCIFLSPIDNDWIRTLQDLVIFAQFNPHDQSVDMVCYNKENNSNFLLNSFYI